MDLNQRKNSGLDLTYLQDYSDILESQLTRMSSAYKMNQKDYSFESIRSELDNNEVYIDIVEMIMPFNNNVFIDNPLVGNLDHRYYAYIITKDNLYPKLI